jgi:uncharacterized protein
MPQSTLPAPPDNLEARDFFAATREGRFLLKRSVLTQRAHWYPRSQCPFDGSDTEWFEASGRGTIYTFTIIPGPETYAVAYVTLAEGPTMLTNIVDCDLTALAVGQPVSLVLKAAGDFVVPCFKSADAG